LEGKRQKKSVQSLLEDPLLQFSGLYQQDYSDLYVVCQIFANGKPLTLSAQTAYKAFSNRWNWNEWITLPIPYKDIPRNAVLALTIYDILGPRKTAAVGGTTIPIFGKHGCLRRGIHDLRVWPDREADGSLKNGTPGERDMGESAEGGEGAPMQMVRLSKLVQKHRKRRMMIVDWLDRLTFREIEVINEREKRESNFMYINVEFPKFHYDSFDYSVVFFEQDGELADQPVVESDFQIVSDPEWDMDNVVELKHHRLTHTIRKGQIARDIKPNAKLRGIIMNVVNLPPTQVLMSNEKSLIWQFRYYLMQEKAALPKFLQSVSWQVKQEAEEAIDLLYKWQPLDAAEALELLTPTYTEPKVRKYAISRLKCADNDELLLYLLQLVQALRYEEPAFFSEQLPPQEHSALALSLEETYSEGMGGVGVGVCLH
jgi:phosphatidylinositol 3-kinase